MKSGARLAARRVRWVALAIGVATLAGAWELQKGKGGPYEDPVSKTMGCFDATRFYPTDRLVLTYPVKC